MVQTDVVEFPKRFDLCGTVSLVEQITNYFGKKPLRIMTQLELFPGYNEVAVLLEDNLVFRCLVADGKQVSDWMRVEKGPQQ